MTDSKLMEINRANIRESGGSLVLSIPPNIRDQEGIKDGDKMVFFRNTKTRKVEIRFEKAEKDA